ncbi:hypothetical protein B2J73_00825 [Stutzerimonas stutzeri]|uniref:hypothetical protein n=1 Tax=Stutzerimonas stutzeri TaxID=316 RepID=UPI0009A3F0BD|nr:hypothetical protein [Stutzerimonas stutzeri]OPG85300.1 hypothetical protein B2J73_00825 [Stutzerimonas stutzeri]
MTTKQNTKLHVQQPRQLDKGELDARIEKAIERYKGSHASCQAVDEPILLLYTKKVIELVAAGYSLNEKLPCRSGTHSYTAYFSKPAAMQEADIEALKLEVEEKYKAEIEAHNEAQIELLTIQLAAQEEAKEKKKQEEKEAKRLADARKEAEAFFASIKENK